MSDLACLGSPPPDSVGPNPLAHLSSALNGAAALAFSHLKAEYDRFLALPSARMTQKQAKRPFEKDEDGSRRIPESSACLRCTPWATEIHTSTVGPSSCPSVLILALEI